MMEPHNEDFKVLYDLMVQLRHEADKLQKHIELKLKKVCVTIRKKSSYAIRYILYMGKHFDWKIVVCIADVFTYKQMIKKWLSCHG